MKDGVIEKDFHELMDELSDRQDPLYTLMSLAFPWETRLSVLDTVEKILHQKGLKAVSLPIGDRGDIIANSYDLHKNFLEEPVTIGAALVLGKIVVVWKSRKDVRVYVDVLACSLPDLIEAITTATVSMIVEGEGSPFLDIGYDKKYGGWYTEDIAGREVVSQAVATSKISRYSQVGEVRKSGIYGVVICVERRLQD